MGIGIGSSWNEPDPEYTSYSVDVICNYTYDTILVKAYTKRQALLKFIEFTKELANENNFKGYHAIKEAIKKEGISFFDEYTEDDFTELNKDIMLLAQSSD